MGFKIKLKNKLISGRVILCVLEQVPHVLIFHVVRYVDDISFKLESSSSGGCSVLAKSSSQTWYAVLDKGTNYCNLRNLIDGSGLSSASGFTESTRDKVCTQYSSRDCSRF